MILQGEHIQLKTLSSRDVTQKYVDWMNDSEVVQYTESRFMKHTMESVIGYVKDMACSSNDYFYGIYIKEHMDNKPEHIGNIKLHIDTHHALGDMGIIIGDKAQWGKGYATEAIRLLTEHGFDKLGLHKISAGIYANNVGGIKAFQRAGYRIDGIHEASYKYNGEWINEINVSVWSE